jgi:hypothetical protein
MRITFDAQELLVVGILRTHRIPRLSILDVDDISLDRPTVRWATPAGTDRWTVLSPLQLSSGALVPRSMRLRRRRYLALLRRWAAGAPQQSVQPGIESQVYDALGRAALAVWDSPVLRIVLAVLLVAVAMGAYWLGWVRSMEIINGEGTWNRGLMAAVFFAGAALEGAYWLLPLPRRHPRMWHVILGIVLAPLAVVFVGALFH